MCEMPFDPIASDKAGGAGGTCVLRGCVPKKLMVYGGEFAQAFRDSHGFGYSTADVGTLHDCTASQQHIVRVPKKLVVLTANFLRPFGVVPALDEVLWAICTTWQRPDLCNCLSTCAAAYRDAVQQDAATGTPNSQLHRWLQIACCLRQQSVVQGLPEGFGLIMHGPCLSDVLPAHPALHRCRSNVSCMKLQEMHCSKGVQAPLDAVPAAPAWAHLSPLPTEGSLTW